MKPLRSSQPIPPPSARSSTSDPAKLLYAARQGDPQAIASLINQVFERYEIRVEGRRSGPCLYLRLGSDRVLRADPILARITKGLSQLQPLGIETVRVYAQLSGVAEMIWAYHLDLISGSTRPLLASSRSVQSPAQISRSVQPPVQTHRSVQPPAQISRSVQSPVQTPRSIDASALTPRSIQPSVSTPRSARPPGHTLRSVPKSPSLPPLPPKSVSPSRSSRSPAHPVPLRTHPNRPIRRSWLVGGLIASCAIAAATAGSVLGSRLSFSPDLSWPPVLQVVQGDQFNSEDLDDQDQAASSTDPTSSTDPERLSDPEDPSTPPDPAISGVDPDPLPDPPPLLSPPISDLEPDPHPPTALATPTDPSPSVTQDPQTTQALQDRPGSEADPQPSPQTSSLTESAVPTLNPTISPEQLALRSIPTPPPISAATITIKAVGDIVPGTDFPYSRLPVGAEETLFASVKPLLTDADLVFGNFESTLTDHPISAKDVSRPQVFAFRSPPSYADHLRSAGFNVLSVANNHSMDFTVTGFADTIHHIEIAGMQAVGAKGEIVYSSVQGLQVAWIGFSYLPYHNSVHELDQARSLVLEADQQADLVIISVHAGAEGTGALHVRDQQEIFLGEMRGNLVQFSRSLIDAGADLILGHGPHVPRALELYQGRLIAYSLGNFLGYRTLATAGATGHSLVLEVELNALGQLISGQIHPVQLDGVGIPHPDPYQHSVNLIRQLTQHDFPNTDLQISDTGTISPPDPIQPDPSDPAVAELVRQGN